MPIDKTDTKLVECPDEACPNVATRHYAFEFVDGTVGKHNYCGQCGAGMVEVDNAD